MKKQRRKLSPWLGKSFLIGLFSAIAAIYGLAMLMIPGTIRVRSGETLPAGFLSVEAQETPWLTVNENCIQQNGAIEGKNEGTWQTQATVKLWGVIPLRSVSVEVWREKELIVGGNTLGIDLYTDGILVLGTGKIETENGMVDSPAKGYLYAGDRIRRINGQDMHSMEQVDAAIRQSIQTGGTVTIELSRNGETKTVLVPPIADKNGIMRIGIWIRDRAQGLGTLTFIDPETNGFGAVGHGISDVDLEAVLPIQDGQITQAKIRHLVKGEKDAPGEVEGSLTGLTLGQVSRNTDQGIYGTYQAIPPSKPRLRVALRGEVQEGDAWIYSDVLSEKPMAYRVKLQKTSGIPVFDTGMVITITDERLLGATGGIIQGMSGCPIVQNDKIVGAVTHVFVKDPTRGYGIYIEDMLSQLE